MACSSSSSRDCLHRKVDHRVQRSLELGAATVKAFIGNCTRSALGVAVTAADVAKLIEDCCSSRIDGGDQDLF